MTRAELTEAIKRQALALGFDKVGVVRAEALAAEGDNLREWLARGYGADMDWMRRTEPKRMDPRLHMPEVKTIVSVALNYYTPSEHSGRPGTGKVSRYAWGDDYHDVVGEKLRSLQDWIRSVDCSIGGKIAVDTSPVMDKAWAVRAGIGWLGKHSNVITRELGSWVFLGALLLDVELDYDDSQEADHCGSCTACLDACPTEAIVAPYVVDSNRCISYVTIELRGDELPLDTSGWVYGCDICQDVCPWNRFQRPTSEERFEPRTGLVDIRLDEFASLTQEEFSSRFRGSAIKRAKLRGLTRNVRAVADQEAGGDKLLRDATDE